MDSFGCFVTCSLRILITDLASRMHSVQISSYCLSESSSNPLRLVWGIGVRTLTHLYPTDFLEVGPFIRRVELERLAAHTFIQLLKSNTTCTRIHLVTYWNKLSGVNWLSGEILQAYHLLQFSWPNQQRCKWPELLVADMMDLFKHECDLRIRPIDLNSVLKQVEIFSQCPARFKTSFMRYTDETFEDGETHLHTASGIPFAHVVCPTAIWWSKTKFTTMST